jgi:outer membrane protein assembly factor BamB
MNRVASCAAATAFAAACVWAGDASFPTWRGDPSLAGVVEEKLPDAPVKLWEYASGSPVRFTPVIGDGKVFFVNGKSQVTALSLSGAKVWSRTIELKPADTNTPAEKVAFTAPPTYAFGTMILATADGDVYALDGKDGSEKWRAPAGAAIQASPSFASLGKDGWVVIVISQSDGVLAAFDGATGKEKWRSEPNGRVDGHIAVSGGKIAFGGCDATIHIVSASDGSPVSSIPLGEGFEVAGGVAIVGKMVYTGSRGGALCAVDTAKKDVKWTHGGGSEGLFTTPAASANHVVFSGGNASVTALDLSDPSKVMWDYDGGGMKAESPIIAGDRVVVVVDGKIRMLDLAGGKKVIWTSPSVGDGLTPPAVAGGMLVVGSDSGSVVAFGGKGPAAGGTK